MAYESNGEDGVFTESVLAMAAEPEPSDAYLDGEDPIAPDASLFEGA